MAMREEMLHGKCRPTPVVRTHIIRLKARIWGQIAGKEYKRDMSVLQSFHRFEVGSQSRA